MIQRLRNTLYWIRRGELRKAGFFLTLLAEGSGWIRVLFRWLLLKLRLQPLQPVWIITGIAGRAEQFLAGPLKSWEQLRNHELIFFSIYETSADGLVQQKLEELIPEQHIYRQEEMSFSRAHHFNRAAEQAGEGLFFICDADMQLPENLVWLCNLYAGGPNIWFPKVWMLSKDGQSGHFNPNGFGMMALSRQAWLKLGGYNETAFKTWGGEDLTFLYQSYLSGYYPIRNACSGLKHQWHEASPEKTRLLADPDYRATSLDLFLSIARQGIHRH